MAEKCNTCKSASTCICPNCQRGICLESEQHLNDITDNDVVKWECYEIDPEFVEKFKKVSDQIHETTKTEPVFVSMEWYEHTERGSKEE